MLRTSPLLLVGLAVLTLAACGGGGSAVDSGVGPSIASIEPASGGQAGGTPIVIRGSNLANPQPGEYQVLIGGQPAEDVIVVDSTEVECKTPPGAAGAADVVIVTITGEGDAPSGFMYYPPPTVTAITPDEGTRDGGVLVTVEGSGFLNNDPGESVCTIGLKPLDDQVIVDDSTITGLTPTSWTEVPKNVDVVNRNGQGTLNNGFTYVGPVPVIYSVTPIEGPRSGGTAVTITGDYYTEAGGELSVRFGSAEASVVTRIDDQTLTCITPLSSIAGLVDVTVGNNNGESSLPDAFYYIPAPVLSGLTPATGSIQGGTLCTLSGTGFTAPGAGTTLVTLGDKPVVNQVIVNDSTITFDTPPGDVLGLVDLRIVNGNGTDLLTNVFEYTFSVSWDANYASGALTGPTCDDCSLLRSISGFSFPFFASSTANIYLSSNGTVGIGSSYSSLSSTVPTVPHISPFQNDMNPSTGGTIYFKQYTDRVVITYLNVNEYYSGPGNGTCQIQLFQNGIFAMLFQSVTVVSYHMSVGPGPGQSATSVDWSTAPSIGATQAAYQIFGTFDLTDKILAFLPDGSNGYTTLILDNDY